MQGTLTKKKNNALPFHLDNIIETFQNTFGILTFCIKKLQHYAK